MNEPAISLIVPTRRRTRQLRRLLDSIKTLTHDLSQVEAILVVDHDDEESLNFQYEGVMLRRVKVPRGTTMGGLNRSGYGASSGRYVMLLNDDVVVATPNWDEHILDVFRAYPDGIVLVHVNDKLFREKLCIFPFLTREFCLLAGNICPEGYIRYRIDDHIHNIFDLLSSLGHHRRIFLPDVVFEHSNVEFSGDEVHYVPDRAIHDLDTRLFHAFLEERKRVAIEALRHIDAQRHSERCATWEKKLDLVTDSISIRRDEHTRWLPAALASSGRPPRVTVGVVSADLRASHAQKCIELVKACTANYDLILIDNNGDPSFNHAREMGRLLSICNTDYLVLMDDDVFVEPGWLDGMLRCMGPEVGVVTPQHKDGSALFSYAGIVMCPDDSGHNTHVLERPRGPRRIQTLCSAIMLIDMPKCGHIRLDERCTKYFLDIDYGLRVWEAGYHVVCSPYSEVTHLAGATLRHGALRSDQLFDEQRRRYVKSWVDSGRIEALRQGIWKTIPEIEWISDRAGEIDHLVQESPVPDWDEFTRHAASLFDSLKPYPALRDYIAAHALFCARTEQSPPEDAKWKYLVFLLELAGVPILLEAGFQGMNIVSLQNFIYYALPQGEGAFSYERMVHDAYSQSYEADGLEALKDRIRECSDARFLESIGSCNICAVGKSFAVIPQEIGEVDFRVRAHRENRRIIWTESLRQAREAAAKSEPRENGDGSNVLPIDLILPAQEIQ